MSIRTSAETAGWSIREAAWDLEERVLWRGSDAARDVLERGRPAAERARDLAEEAADRAQEAVEPLQRLVQTKLTWPLGDALRERSMAARAGLAGAAAATAIAAGVAGATLGTPADTPDSFTADNPPVAPVVQTASSEQVLQGTAPPIETGEVGIKAPPPPPAAEQPDDPPSRVAWNFANAFVLYEVGKSDSQTTATFEQTADPALAKSLALSPPRMPSGTKVPEARVLNVVLADRTKKQVTASVSLARLRAVSEVRLTLTHTDEDGWKVVQVLG
jgi:hypothetical protein